MKTWAEMTERERDVLAAQALGWKVIEVSASRTFKAGQEKDDWYPVTTTNTKIGSTIGWLEGIHWTREGEKIHYGNLHKVNGTKEGFRAWDIPHFSTDRAAAMSLLDGERWYNLRKREESFYCKLPTFEGNEMFDDCERGVYFVSGRGTTESEAICLAFLRSKGIHV